MDMVILICCCVIIVLLIAILIKLLGGSQSREAGEIKNELNHLSENNRMILEQSSRQNEAAVNQIDRLGQNIRETLSKTEEQMGGLRRENQQSLTDINKVVTEKMQSTLDEKLNGVSHTVVKNISELGKTLGDSQEKQRAATVESLEKLREAFENIRREINSTLLNISKSNSEAMEKLRSENRESLDKINSTVNEKLQETLNDRIAKSFETVNQRLKEVYEGLGEMKTVASGVNDLKSVLSNVKTRGTLGEIQLGAILEEILAPEQYGSQVQVAPDSKERVDFAVKLPGSTDDSIWLPIDSKFPGDTYAALQKAYDSGDPEAVKAGRKVLAEEIRRCAKSIKDKYIKIPYTTNFAIMFLPFEGLYAEVVNMGLIEILQREHQVNIAGPSTMAAMLNSLRMGFKTLAIQKKSGEMSKILAAAKKEFATFENGLNQIHKKLEEADKSVDELLGKRTRAINRKLASIETLDSDEEASKTLSDNE